MKPSFTLTDIVNFGTIGGDHLSGEARFSDGKRYRFVIDSRFDFDAPGYQGKGYPRAPAVLKMALPYMPPYGSYGKPPEEQWAWGNDHRVFPKRAALIMEVYPAYLKRAKADKAARDAEEEAKQKEAQKAYLLDKALKDAAPDLLKACQAQVNPLIDRQVAHEAILAAITKATTIPQSI